MSHDKIDVFWGTRQILPPYLPGRIKKVLVSYDLVWHYFPETMETYNRLVSKVLFKRSIRSADRVVIISDATAHSLAEVLGVRMDKISIAYPAADYCPLDKEESAKYISKAYGTHKKYILKVISDSELQDKMIWQGLERAKLFSWDESARRTLKVFESVFKSGLIR